MSEAADATFAARSLAGERIHLLGPLASMSQRDASKLLQQHGAEVAAKFDPSVTLLVVGDETSDWRSRLGPMSADSAELHPFEVLKESELWRQIGLCDSAEAAAADERLYTTAMLAELVDAPVEAIKRWLRRGYLQPARQVGKLPYFDTAEVYIARRLAGLLADGCPLSRIDKLVAQLCAAAPDVDRPLAELAVVAQEGRFYLRRGEDLAEPHGQLLLDFDEPTEDEAEPPANVDFTPTLAFEQPRDQANENTLIFQPEDARTVALELQAAGDLPGAIEACRAALFAGGDIDDHLLLAELLYRHGEVLAARERYYIVLELDDEDVEARVSLGCLLSETGEHQLATAAFRGAIAQQPGFADAHYHLARTLDDLGQTEEAEDHWRQFLTVAPASPWGEEAADRLGLEPVGVSALPEDSP